MDRTCGVVNGPSAYFPRNLATSKYPLTRNFKLNDVVREFSDFLRICDFLHVLETTLEHGLIRREFLPIWSDGCIFEAVRATGLRFQSDPLNGISDSAKELIRGMLHTDPSVRFTAQQVLDHTWTSGTGQIPKSPPNCGELTLSGSPTSSLFMARNDDISFGLKSLIICETFSCKSSFSSFLVEPVTPLVNSCGFSFCSSGGSSNATLDFCTPIHSMPSFTFFGPGPDTDPDQDPPVCLLGLGTKEVKEQRLGEVKRGEKSRISGIHSKRNRTIGLGEFVCLTYVL
ncbi:hypothetical protein L2E82_49279 [Cichorium intybus]|uniref:Uncharacterized protein n=1 Tax=Cichorium intybus TaxID=13427 RepID=A0ACB8Z0B6_CICIN|nr:hypothetical protein L2E82_49279 [Cichorium intybus]